MPTSEPEKSTARDFVAFVSEILICLIMLVLLVTYSMRFLIEQNTSGGGFRTFYKEVPESIDLIVFGSSHAACTFNNSIFWDEAGISSFTLSSGGQNLPETYYYIVEALKTQKPKVILIETVTANLPSYNTSKGHYSLDMGTLYRSDLPMKFSRSYIQMINEQAALYGMSDSLKWDMILKYPVIHNNYTAMTRENFRKQEPYIRGYRGDYSIGTAVLPEYTEEREELTDLCEDTINRIIDLCAKNDVVPVFFHAPCFEYTRNYAVQNSIGDIVNSRGCYYIDFNRLINVLGIDFDSDFRDDGGHLNNSGAEKVTRYLLKYVTENFDLPDHRGDEQYHAWELNSRYMQDRELEHKLKMAVGLDEYMSLLSECRDEYDIIVSLDGRYNILGPEPFADALARIGIAPENYLTGGTVLASGDFSYYSSGDFDQLSSV